MRCTVQIFPLRGHSTLCFYTSICPCHGLQGPPHSGPSSRSEPKSYHSAHPAPPQPSCSALNTQEPSSLRAFALAVLPTWNAFLNLYRVQSLALYRPQLKCHLLRKACPGHSIYNGSLPLLPSCPSLSLFPHPICFSF